MAGTGLTLLQDGFNRIQNPSANWSIPSATPDIGFYKWTPTTAGGAALLGSDSLRVRALLPDGMIGDIYLSESEWEQV